MNFIKHSLGLLSSFAFVFLWQNSILSVYTIPFLGFLIFLFIALSTTGKKYNPLERGGTKTVLVLNAIILLIIMATNGLYSPLFFLLYFVLFGIAFVFEPSIVLVYVLIATALFLNQALEGDTTSNLLQLASLYIIGPLAFYFGKEYKKHSKTQ